MVFQKGWTVYTYQEEYGLLALNGQKVVDDMSSCLNSIDIETIQRIASKYMDMCRYRGPNDPEFAKVAAVCTPCSKS